MPEGWNSGDTGVPPCAIPWCCFVMKTSGFSCWKCATAIEELLMPVARLAKCKACKADLHVCKMCRFYDPTVSNSCAEPVAEKVTDKQRSNFCGYYQPDPEASLKSAKPGASAAKSQLDALFGLGNAVGEQQPAASVEEESRRKLAELFGIKPDAK